MEMSTFERLSFLYIHPPSQVYCFCKCKKQRKNAPISCCAENSIFFTELQISSTPAPIYTCLLTFWFRV